MGAQDKETGAPSGAPTLDDALAERIDTGPVAAAFLQRLRAMAVGLSVGSPESDFYALEHALQLGKFQSIDDDGDLYAIGTKDLVEYVKWWQKYVSDERARLTTPRELTLKLDLSEMQPALTAMREEIDAYLTDHKRLVRELDVALNGLETGAQLDDLVAQVQRQQCVQILNMTDGMRINFRAPDGRRSTMHLRVLLDQWALDPTMTRIYEPMRDAIAAYPVAGEPLPEAHSDAHDAAQVASLGASQVSPSMALPSQRIEE